MKKRFLSVILATAMVSSLLSGCGAKETATSSANNAAVTSTAVTEEGSTSEEPITFTYFHGDGKDSTWDNTVGNAVTAATGVSLDISYPIDNGGEPKEYIALMIAEDKYPDLVFAKGSAIDLYDAGAYIDMRPLIEEYGPNIKKMYGDEFEKLRWSTEDDGIYQLSFEGVDETILTAKGPAQIQYAVLKENDWKYPTTIPEYEKMIKDYLAAHPTTDDGLERIGITISASDWHWMITLGNPAGFIADTQQDNGQLLVDENFNVTYKHVTPEEKEYFQWLNRMYNEGILDPNFATQTDDDYIAKVSSGRVVAILDAAWHFNKCNRALISEGKMDQTYCSIPVTLREGQKSPMLQRQGLIVGQGIGITKDCKDPVRAVKFLDYICSDEGAMLYRWGVEGENYFLDDNGMPYRTAEEVEKANSDPDYGKKTGIGMYAFPIYGDGAYSESGIPYTPVTKDSIIKEYNDMEKEACAAWGVEMLIDIYPQADEFPTPEYSPLWAYTKTSEMEAKEDDLNDIAWKGLVKAVMCSEAEFEGCWNEMVNNLEDAGLREFEKTYTDWLADKMGR